MNCWVAERARLSHPLNEPLSNKLFAMLAAYLDESGTHADSHVSLVAGYYGSVNEWRRFEREWKQVLADFGVTEFHAKAFWARGRGSGEFRDWEIKKRDAFICALLKVILGRKIYPFACGVLRSEWDKLTLVERKLFTGATQPHLSGCPSKPHFMGFQIAVLKIADYCQPHLRVNYVMDEDPRSSGWASRCYAQLKKDTARSDRTLAVKLGDITFADSKEAVPLQAADLLAYEAARYVRNSAQANDPNLGMSPQYALALKRAKSREDFWLFDAPRIARWKRTLEATAE